MFEFSIIIIFTIFFPYWYVHTCSIVKNLEFCKYNVKENLDS